MRQEALNPQVMKRITTTPKLLGLLVGSLLLSVGLIAFDNSPKDSATDLVVVILVWTFLLAALAAFTVLVWRLLKRIGLIKSIILCGAVAFLLCGLFPPWLYISSEGHTHAAGCDFILSPPTRGNYKLDTARLAVEWLCIVVATGIVWLLVSKPEKAKDSKES